MITEVKLCHIGYKQHFWIDYAIVHIFVAASYKSEFLQQKLVT
jgi:hypothetical protein